MVTGFVTSCIIKGKRDERIEWREDDAEDVKYNWMT
jgi:hypothetical protein